MGEFEGDFGTFGDFGNFGNFGWYRMLSKWF